MGTKASRYGPNGVGYLDVLQNFFTKGCNEIEVGANPIK